jgi:hypothetical protein
MIFGHVVPEWSGSRMPFNHQRHTTFTYPRHLQQNGPTSARLKRTHSYYKPGARIYVQAPNGPCAQTRRGTGGIKSRTRCRSYAFSFFFSSSCGWHNLKFFSVLLESFISGSHRSVSYAPDESKLQARPTIVGFGVFHTPKSWLGGRTYQTFCPVMYMRCGSTHVLILDV